MTKRPRLSKALAARIRGAQYRLEAQIQTHIWADKDIREIQDKLAAFEADPEGWSEKHYPGHGPESYPVQTRITRSRETLDRKLASREHKLRELREAEENQKRVEAEVEEQAKRIRSTTVTEPWPKPVQGIEVQALILKRELEEYAERSRQENDLREAEYAAEEAKETERRARESQEAISRHVARGPEHVIMHQMTNLYIRNAYEEYKRTSEYADALQGDWAGGLTSFVSGPRAAEASAQGAARAQMIIAETKAEAGDLWGVCRRFGFWTPDGVH